ALQPSHLSCHPNSAQFLAIIGSGPFWRNAIVSPADCPWSEPGQWLPKSERLRKVREFLAFFGPEYLLVMCRPGFGLEAPALAWKLEKTKPGPSGTAPAWPGLALAQAGAFRSCDIMDTFWNNIDTDSRLSTSTRFKGRCRQGVEKQYGEKEFHG
ncbi:hypothetical protein F5050DRAFT_1710019, partial [Lentinula boryana]